jgi:hypothetical protein
MRYTVHSASRRPLCIVCVCRNSPHRCVRQTMLEAAPLMMLLRITADPTISAMSPERTGRSSQAWPIGDETSGP